MAITTLVTSLEGRETEQEVADPKAGALAALQFLKGDSARRPVRLCSQGCPIWEAGDGSPIDMAMALSDLALVDWPDLEPDDLDKFDEWLASTDPEAPIPGETSFEEKAIEELEGGDHEPVMPHLPIEEHLEEEKPA